MTDKEYIIINGKKRDCKILFRCKHIDDTAAYDMMCEGIEIKPENAPVSDSELMLIENTDSPFGFSFVCKINNKNNKEDVWEYSGFGNSGACSIVTALLKQFTRKSQECEELENTLAFSRKCVRYNADVITSQQKDVDRYRKALDEIEEIAKDGLNPICYKSNCSRCKCYNGDDCKAGMISLINNYFTENGEFADGNGDFAEALEDLLDKERSRCNRALSISKKILDIINKVKGERND